MSNYDLVLKRDILIIGSELQITESHSLLIKELGSQVELVYVE